MKLFTEEEVLRFGEVFQIAYNVLEETGSSTSTYNLTASFTACGLISKEGGCTTYDIGNLYNECNPSDVTTTTPQKRKKRDVDRCELIDNVNSLNPQPLSHLCPCPWLHEYTRNSRNSCLEKGVENLWILVIVILVWVFLPIDFMFSHWISNFFSVLMFQH